MHEMGIANSLLDSVRSEARRFPGRHIHSVGVRIGELSGVNSDSLSFCFEVLVRGTDLEPLTLAVDYRPCLRECQSCGSRFTASESLTCPHCQEAESRIVGGDELELAYLEVEDGTGTA
ncbi:MAG TPA: hydrogenase maturation nickel metallochaperone HypA [Terriglobales bacterium]|nr:hydrogenase maturation nickel metallochaperone HypA [Terriglobales bacterium]